MQLENVTARQIEPGHRTQAPKALRLAFSFSVAIAALLTVLTVLTVRSRFNDPDLWWHLKTGEIIWKTHVIPTVDTFSYTTHNHAYTPHEWLSQLTIYAAYHFGGYSGLMLWLCVLASLLLIGSYVLCSFYSGNCKVALLGALAAWLFSTIGLAARPQVLGYLLLVCELLIIYLGRSRNSRWFFALPPLFALWVNCHGSFFLGLMVLSSVVVCSFLNFRVGFPTSRIWDVKRRTTLAWAFALSFAALFVNPIGIEQMLYPVKTALTQKVGLATVAEWQPLSLGDPRAWALLAVTGFVILIPARRRSLLYVEELLQLALGAVFAAQHQRMLFVFGILAAPILCRVLRDAWDSYDPDRDRMLPNGFLIAASVLVAVFAFPGTHDLEAQVTKSSPVRAVEFIRRSGLSGRMLNEYVYGGYLIWAAPEHKVFIDGRGDVYDWTGVFGEFAAWATLQQDPQRLLEKYRIDFCLLSREAPMSRVFPLLPGWKLVYSDALSAVFARSGA